MTDAHGPNDDDECDETAYREAEFDRETEIET